MYAFLNVLLKRVLGKLKSVSNYCESHFWKASRFVFWRAFYRDGRAFRNGRFSRTSQISPPVLRLWLNKSRANEPTVSLACWYLHPLRGWESKTTPPPPAVTPAQRVAFVLQKKWAVAKWISIIAICLRHSPHCKPNESIIYI